jgi:lysozyme
MNKHLFASQALYALIKGSEGFEIVSYRCPSGVWTIGWGHTKDVKAGMKISPLQADKWLHEDVAEAECAVKELVTVPLTQGQFDALVDFVFNVGADIDDDTIAEGLGDSTLLKLLNAGDYVGAAKEIDKWIFGGKPRRRLPGLVSRRAKDRKLFESKTEVK